MRRFYVEIAEVPFRRLQRRAEAERRDVRDQAALLIERALAENAADAEVAPPPFSHEGGDR